MQSVSSLRLCIHANHSGSMPVPPSVSPCPAQSVVPIVLDSLCDLWLVLQIAAAKNAVSNGSAANGNGAAVVSNGNGAAATVQPPSPAMIKDFCAPWTVPESGIADALGLMASGDLFRYNRKDADSTVSRAECALAAYTGHKYCLALNSGGSAIFLALVSAGVKNGDKVNDLDGLFGLKGKGGRGLRFFPIFSAPCAIICSPLFSSILLVSLFDRGPFSPCSNPIHGSSCNPSIYASCAQVFSNALTFGAVPSAIHHAGASVEFVESTSAYVIDIDHFEKKCQECPDVRFLLISHMRGKLADMDGVERVCKKYNVTLVEDCAHSLGVYWDGQHSGHKGVAACVSTQAYKMLNSGEGGFLLTNDPVSSAERLDDSQRTANKTFPSQPLFPAILFAWSVEKLDVHGTFRRLSLWCRFDLHGGVFLPRCYNPDRPCRTVLIKMSLCSPICVAPYMHCPPHARSQICALKLFEFVESSKLS